MLLREFSGVRILSWFLDNPTRKVHFKELCRELELSPLTVKTYCEECIGYGWLSDERRANLRLFGLNNAHFSVRAIKRAYFVEKLRSAGIEKIADDGIVSFALYGSYSSGEYDERSDVDLIAVGRKENIDYAELEKVEKKAGKKIQLMVFPLEKWESNKTKDPFMLAVLRNNVILRGAVL